MCFSLFIFASIICLYTTIVHFPEKIISYHNLSYFILSHPTEIPTGTLPERSHALRPDHQRSREFPPRQRGRQAAQASADTKENETPEEAEATGGDEV